MAGGQTGIGKNIKKLRLAKGFGKSELARYVGVSPTAVHNWEEYGVNPRPELLPLIAKALATTATAISGNAAHGSAPSPPKDVATLVRTFKSDVAQVLGIRPDQVEVSINFKT